MIAGGHHRVVESPQAPKTAVCVLRVEQRRPRGVLITLIMTPDVETVTRGETRSVTSYDEAIGLVEAFLRQCMSVAEPKDS